MSEISERYARLADAFTAKVAAVEPDRWANPSPCEQWTARDVVRHVIEAHGTFLRLVGRELGDAPAVEDDPLAAWTAARATVQADLEDPDRASATYTGVFGEATFEDSIDGFICADLLIHGWDLARATGLDETIDLDEARRVTERFKSFGDKLRGPGVLGPEIEPPPGADEQTRFLAFTGRSA
ncbi:MAG: TIGR03086 family metal-binding protein [Acidimicrobiia bacterium]